MDPMTAAAVGGGMGSMNGISSYINMKSANSANKKAALTQFMYNNMLMNRQIEWEKERATHAHQWEMQDLKAAGLNPALTATGGSGATTGSISAPTNAMPNMQGLNMANLGDIIGQVINLKNQTEATNASNANEYSQAILNIAYAKYVPFKNKMELLSNIINQQNADANTTNAATNRMNAQTNRDALDSSPTKAIGRKINEKIEGYNDYYIPSKKPKHISKKEFYKPVLGLDEA